jgi:solute carrier family 6 GABA transporter-like protein 1
MTEGEGRERWSSRLAFIFVAIGAAIGYGNVWRFPALAYQYGGGAFFIPYILALFIVGIPLLVLEIALGQVYQQGDMGAFGEINKRLRGIGVTSIMNGYFIVCYYAGLIAYTLHAFAASFTDLEGKWSNVTGTEAYNYFLNSIVGYETLGADQMPTRLVWQNVVGLAVAWAATFFAVAGGVQNEGRITFVTMGVPIVLLFVFLGRSVTLPGAQDGIKAYIGEWDMAVLTEKPDVWSTAVSQIFFSIGVTFGIMTAFGSHCEPNAPAFSNAVIIACSNSFYSFIAGFAVFSGLGYLALLENTTIDKLNVGGPGLLFGSYPVVLATLPGGQHWVRLLFITLFMLGIDSAFALLEAVLTVLKDTRIVGHYPTWGIALVTCVLSFVFGLLYVTDAGFNFLDVVDFYINFIMLFVGFLEAFGAGWMYGLEKQISNLGAAPVYLYMYGTMSIWTAAAVCWFNLSQNAMLVGWLIVAGGYVAMAVLLMMSLSGAKHNNPDRSTGSLLYELMFGNIFDMCDDFGQIVGYLPKWWGIIIKHILPPLLLVLFINLASAKNGDKPLFGNYGNYVEWPYQIMGIFIVALTLAVFGIGVLCPDAYSFLVPPEIEATSEMEMKKMEDENRTIDIPMPEQPALP